jgi:hypothetical protein
MTKDETGMVSPAEVRESHEQFSEAWSLYARNSGIGEVVDMKGFRIANARLPWFLFNGAILSAPVSSQEDLAAHVEAAVRYFGSEKQPWFFIGGEQWMGKDAPETLSRLGFSEAFKVTGMVCDQLAPPHQPLPEVETRRIEDEAGRLALADLNATAYDVSSDWIRKAVGGESLWKTPLYGYNAYIEGQPVATAFAVQLNSVIYVAYAATANAHRRKGLAELVIRRCVEHATLETGISRTVLHATADGYSVYLKMGYRPVEQFSVYVKG